MHKDVLPYCLLQNFQDDLAEEDQPLQVTQDMMSLDVIRWVCALNAQQIFELHISTERFSSLR